MLRELTDLVPSDAWLTSLSFDTKGVELSGQAAAASTLIPLLENSSRLDRVEFSSPVTKGRDNKEQFRIKAAWESASSRPSSPAAETQGTPPPRAPGRRAPGRAAGEGAAPVRAGNGASR
jgi:Tfp pilus assembly protein PilN